MKTDKLEKKLGIDLKIGVSITEKITIFFLFCKTGY
jgi:hypothetical protein